jgi:hypothetical protein
MRLTGALTRQPVPRAPAGAQLSAIRGIRVVAMAGAKPQLWALDFDGVVCDSCGESSLSAWKVGGDRAGVPPAPPPPPPRCAATDLRPPLCAPTQAASALWPGKFDTPEALQQKGQVVEKMRAVRPVVETG